MESQDGISVRPMRLKVLYTFDDENKQNCLARWPHVLDVQTAFLDEGTQIGVIELKTCIQAIVSASPELVAKLGQDYTVYAYDYSEYETPLVGQGMLSWVLASASPTPNAPAHQSKTIVTGRVRKNVMGIFSKGVQETLEVKLRLVPVPTVLQSEYLDSMQKYRELSNIIPGDFDAQSWSSFIQQNPSMFATQKAPQSAERTSSPVDQSGIEHFHQLLSEGATPREIPLGNRADSPSMSPYGPPSRASTPGGVRTSVQQTQLPTSFSQETANVRKGSEASFRPSSRASAHETDYARQPHAPTRRGSVQSGYGSGEESTDQQPRKRAKLIRSDWPGKDELNIERQPGSLRVAASTAASVRIHRPTPVNPSIAATIQGSNEEPMRPPTPISRSRSEVSRRPRAAPSLLREASSQSVTYRSPYAPTEERPSTDSNTTTSPPEENRYQGIFEQHFNMPSSPPVISSTNPPNPSSPMLPPHLPIDLDSGFMSASIEELLDEDGCLRTNLDDDTGTPFDECRRTNSNEVATEDRTVDTSYPGNSPANLIAIPVRSHESFLGSDGVFEQCSKEAPPSLPPQRGSGSRPSSRASIRLAPKPLAPAPMSQSEVEQLMSSVPASDPVLPPTSRLQHSQSWTGPMSDFPSMDTPAPQSMEDGKMRSGAGARRVRQVQARLDKCIRDGRVPPYCENCGAIETPTWRRAWSKEMQGSEQDAQEFSKDPLMLFWQVVEKDEEEKVTKFKLYKKTLADTDNDFVQILLCNPCGLWLHKFKTMRPENKWNKPPKDKRKRPSRSRKGPLSAGGTATRSRSRTQDDKPADSSPGQSDTSSPAGDDGITPHAENDNENEDELQDPPSKRRRANSAEPRKSTDTAENRWHDQGAIEALRRAIQSSPARNLEARNSNFNENQLTPKPVRRTLFPNAQDGPMRTLNDSFVNSQSPRRSPRIASRSAEKREEGKENHAPARHDNLDELFESPSFETEPPSTPTPKRRSPRGLTASGKSLSMPFCSPTARKSSSKDGTPRLTPAKLVMERLQRAQQQVRTTGMTPPRSKKNGDFAIPELPSLHSTPRSRNHISIEGLSMDIFDELATADPALYNFLSPKGSNGADWTNWITTDLPSPSEVNLRNSRLFNSTDHGDSEDIMNAILSDADAEHAGLRESAFDSLIFGVSNGGQENRSQRDAPDYFTDDHPNSGSSTSNGKDAPPKASGTTAV